MEIRWIKHDNLASTNMFVSDLLKHQKPKEGLVVIADYQDTGKGQGAKSWHSQKGENLLMSLLLFPAFLSASNQFQISRVISVSLCEVLDALGAAPVIKWPNDILTSRGKIAGILIENGISGGKIAHTIAGIGLNLNQSEFPEFPQPASSLFLETGRKTLPQELAETLVARIMIRYQKLKGGEELALEKEYLDSLFRLGETSLFEAGGLDFEGIVRGVNEFGELLVEREGELASYGHGEIALKVAHRSQ
jgi:BirA family biotin operon repressor/biotin-[acetyl-CoA-carboxylase] ligase